ncbi:PREDICTED: T-cell surface antigen CD2 [Propithecus coquereli]|uniref:T-cell surface antigen CD2 n=1 Tax=Propithecus coquereli TaxID=379532 RepID=A0A2K6EXQ2_PROCO|nr:PREDICTED: T-cell surface antigen CD2 [Propithecus coquereli]
MNLSCKILANLLLIFNFSTKDAVPSETGNPKEAWGVLDQEINLDIPNFQMNNDIDDIKWEKEGPNKTRVAQFKKDKTSFHLNETYAVLANGTLKIKSLKKNSGGTYKVSVYNTEGKFVQEKTFHLKIIELVSKPEISWDCINTTLTCEVVKGTDPELKLYQNQKHFMTSSQRVITHKWTTRLNAMFKCTAKNRFSEESSEKVVNCLEKGLDIYLIAGICGGGILFIIFVALLIFYISKRKKQNRRRNNEELEIRVHRVATEERSQKPHQMPASVPQNPGASQAPPPPSHRSQAPGHRPLPPGHRVQHQPQRRPPPSSGTQVHQHKGPPLPRPRVQPKPPRGAAEHMSSPSSN